MFCGGTSLARIALLIFLVFSEVKVTHIRLLYSITRTSAFSIKMHAFSFGIQTLESNNVIEMVGYSSVEKENPLRSIILMELALFIGTLNREEKKFSLTPICIIIKFPKSTHEDNSIQKQNVKREVRDLVQN